MAPFESCLAGVAQKNQLKPWGVKSWVIPTASPAFVCQMEQVLAAYQRPYDPAFPVVCFDESPQQLIKEKREPFFDAKGTKHIDYEYIREGVADIFMICEPLGGRREVRIEDNHHRFTYAKTLAYIVEDMYPKAKKITLIEDNLSAHKLSALYEVFEPKRAARIIQKLEIIRTPVHGSWLNIAECELSGLTRQALKERIPSRITEYKSLIVNLSGIRFLQTQDFSISR